MVKVRKKIKNTNVCEMNLLIQKGEEVIDWDDDDLAASIVEEVEIAENSAKEIAEKVKDKIRDVAKTMGWNSVPTTFIREFVSNEIIALGKKYKKKANKYNLIGLSPHEIKAIIENTEGGENSNIAANNPEAVNFAITEVILKKYALQEVFSKEVVDQHMNGNIQLHDLSQPHKSYCSAHSIQYIIKNGLKFPTIKAQSKPPKHAITLTNVICTYLCSVSQLYAGALGLADVNNAYAPFLVGMTDKEIEMLCQNLVFSAGQTAMGKAAQILFIDMNLNIVVPDYLKDTKAIGPCGKYYKLTRKEGRDVLVVCDKKDSSTYSDYEEYSQRFLIQLMKVLKAGDKNGLTFTFPKANVHFTEDCFDEKYSSVRDAVFSCAAENGGVYFLFDRDGESSISQCCRLKTNLTEKQLAQLKEYPEESRFTALQNVSIFLPSAMLEAQEELGDNCNKNDLLEKTINKIKSFMDVAIEAHVEKYKYVKHLYGLENGPWGYARCGMDGKPYIRLDEMKYLIGIIGLDNTIYGITGEHLHESNDAFKMGLKIISNMRIYCDELIKKTKLNLSLEETPAESAAMRGAGVSVRRFGKKAKKIACAGDSDFPYWNNSIHYVYEADVSYTKRIADQSKFHDMIDAGAIVHAFVGENIPPKESIENLVKKTMFKTRCSQFCISPEFTTCSNCSNVELGNHKKCFSCGSKEVDCLTRVVGYFSLVSRWTGGKKEEFKLRNRKVGI